MRWSGLKNITLYLILGIIGLSLCQCGLPGSGSEKGDNDFKIARVDKTLNINYSDLKNRLIKSDLMENGGFLDSTTYFDTLQSIVIDSVLTLLTKEIDLREDIDTYRSFMLRYFQFYSQYIYEEVVVSSIRVDTSDIDSFYQANAEKYTYREQVRARQITISTMGLEYGKDSLKYGQLSDLELDSIAFDLISEIKQRADSGENFGMLAYDHSMHRESGKRNGDLGYFYRGVYNSIFDSVAFSLEPGTISDPFKTPDGWHLINVIDHIDSGLAPFEGQVFETVKNQYLKLVVGERSRAFMDSLVRSAEYEFNDSVIALANYRMIPDTTWSVIINNRDTADFFRLADLMEQYNPPEGQETISLEAKKNILQEFFARYLLVQYAQDVGLNKKDDVKDAIEKIHRQSAVRYLARGYFDPGYMPGDSAIEEYYNRNIDKFTFSKPVYVQHIIVEDSVFGEYLRDLAHSGIDFIELAKEHYPGEPEIREAAADLGYIGPGEMPDVFFNTAIGIPVGDVSHPVKTEFGFHIIKVVDRKYNRELSEVRHDIVLAIREDYDRNQRSKWRRDMLNKYEIEYFLEKIPLIELLPKSVRDPE